MGRYGSIWGDMGRLREIKGDIGRCSDEAARARVRVRIRVRVRVRVRVRLTSVEGGADELAVLEQRRGYGQG